MSQWRANWLYNDATSEFDGWSGTMYLEADDAAGARESIRDEVSRELFDTTAKAENVVVTNVREVP